jgi:hypothetical protein
MVTSFPAYLKTAKPTAPTLIPSQTKNSSVFLNQRPGLESLKEFGRTKGLESRLMRNEEGKGFDCVPSTHVRDKSNFLNHSKWSTIKDVNYYRHIEKQTDE